MNKFQTLKNAHGFAFIDGNLVECDVLRCMYKYNEQTNTLEPHLYGVKAGEEEHGVLPADLYESTEDFMHGKCAELYYNLYLDRKFEVEYDRDNKRCVTWTIEHGKPKKLSLIIDTLYVEFPNGKTQQWAIKATSPDIPDECYASEEDARNHIDVHIKRADGTTEDIVGAANLLALTPEQKKAVEKAVEAIKKAKALGVEFVVDDSDDGLYAYNKNGISDKHYSDCHEGGGYEFVRILTKEFETDACIPAISEECGLNIKRK